MKIAILVTLSILLATISAAPTASAGPCDPDAGPFDPCLYDCAYGIQGFCDTATTAGGAIFKCATLTTCP